MQYAKMSNEDLINDFEYEIERHFEFKRADTNINIIREEILRRMSSDKPAEFK